VRRVNGGGGVRGVIDSLGIGGRRDYSGRQEKQEE
jgi:hypothetical protein